MINPQQTAALFNRDEEIQRLRAALAEIAKEQSALTAQSMADRFQKIAREALRGGK